MSADPPMTPPAPPAPNIPDAPDEREADAYFDALAGRPLGGAAPPPGAQTLREALQAQARSVNEAQAAATEPLPPDAQARLEAVKRKLLADGVFAAPSQRPHPTGPDWLAQLKEWVFGSGWQRPMAVAASVMLGSMLVLQMVATPPTDPDIERGGTTPVLITSDPGTTAQALARKLEQAGAEVLLVQINAQEWSLQVELPRKADPAAVRKLLADAGAPVQGEPPYRVNVRARR